jgi:hypothetical protein
MNELRCPHCSFPVCVPNATATETFWNFGIHRVGIRFLKDGLGVAVKGRCMSCSRLIEVTIPLLSGTPA